MKKRITALVLSVLIALSLLPNAAYAAEANTNTIKLERFGMSGVAYNSAALGRCTLHQMYYDYGGTSTVGFCGEKGKGMGNSLIGQTWGNRQEISDPIVNMMMAYYYAHSTGVFTAEAEALGVDTLWDAGYTWYMNAWVQAIVWRYKGGTLTDPVESCAEELMAVWNSLQNANYTTIDDKADGTSFRDRTQYIIDLGNRGIWGECSVYEYTFTGAGSATHPANTVQSVMIGELNVDVTQESYSLTVKKVDVTNPTKGLPGAKFHIEAVNGSYSKDMTTGADGTFTLTPLVAGTYAVTEVAAPSGYKIDNAGPEYVVLPNNGSNAVTMTFTDTPIVSASGSIRKVDADDPTHGLAGAVIKIEGIDNNFSGSYTTGAGGALVGVPWDSMPIGSYTATEVTPPDGYYLSPDPDKVKQTFYWDGKADVALTFENDSKVKIQLEKLDDSGNPLTGAVFNILKDGQIIGSKAVDAAGILTVSGVTEGLYAFVESNVPKGFQKPMEPTLVYVDAAEIQGGGTIYATAVNQSLPGLRIVKYERGTMKFMEDVTFEIFRDAVSIGTYQTNRKGEILLTDLEPGTYLAVERDTGGGGHVLTTTPQQVELKAGDGIKQLTFFNDRLPGIHLIKVDSGDLSKTIPNARFRFEAVDGSYGPVEYTTSDTGTIDLSKLPVGAYVVTELDCPGYVIDSAQRIIQLDGNEQVQFIFTNSKLPSLHLYKESADGSPLGGVSFRLAKIEDGSFYLDRTTSSNGEILWENLEPGVYSLREISTVSDHILDLREYYIELFPGKVSTKVLQNNQRPNLTIWKFDADDTKVPVEGATFLVEYADGHSIAEVTTGKDGSVTIENLLPSVVKITEKSVPSPYLLDAEPQLVTLYSNRDRDVYFYNHKAPSITIIKEDSITHERLENVKFRVYYASNKTSSGEFRDLGTYVTDEQGEIHLSRAEHGLEDGWFRVVELEPKTGYAIKDSDTQEAFVQSGTSKTFLFENTPLSALVIWKFDNKNSVPLSANFQLKYLGGTSGTGGAVIGTYTTSPVTGSVTITGLKAGTYIVEELAVNSPDHVVDSAPQTVYISGEDQDVVQVHFGNAPKGSLLITKKSDKGEPLAGVEFMVTDSTGAVVGDANSKFWSNSAGEVLISGIFPGTTLIARETKGLDGYVMDDVAQTAVIRAGQTVTLEFINAKKGNLIVQKYGIQGDKKIPLEGVEFKITYADGKFVDTEEGKLSSNGVYFTNKEGQIVLSNVVGTIVATEVASVPGYTIDPNTQTQTVVINAGDDTQTLYFYNQPVGGVEITKVNAADKTERIPDTVFEIRKAGDDALIDTITTGSNGMAFLHLSDGNYYAQEIEANSKFILDGEKHYFEIKDGGTYHLQVKNKAKSQILIHKIDSNTEEGIYGVSFLLYDSNKNPIGQYVSDQDGYVLIDDLPSSGKYYLRELENEGYIVDKQLKIVYVRSGHTEEIEWENTAIRGQIQIIKKSADYNPTNGLPAGTRLEGAVFEIYDKANNLADTIRSNNRGIAISKPLPLSRYTIREVQSPANYGINPTVMTAYLEHEGQIVTFEVENDNLATGVAIKKTGPVEVMPGQPIQYTITGVANTSTVPLQSFYWRDNIPGQITLTRLVTGSYNQQSNYKVVYKTNLSDTYHTLADNLSTTRSYVLDVRSAVLGLASNERITEVMYVFGVVKSGFAQVETPYIYGTVKTGLGNGTSIVNVADVGGLYNGQWIQAVSRWLTNVYSKTTVTLPKTGY